MMDPQLEYATKRIVELENLLLVNVEVANQIDVHDRKVRVIQTQEVRSEPQIKQ